MQKPVLSIGMIFKNEIRCLERCMKSLAPLREAVPCELVMADTGSTDGSRGIAEKYADILFDFAWVNDFSAARNAVMDRCSGTWFMTIDADEWLDADFQQLVQFLRKDPQDIDIGAVVLRDYRSYDEDDRDHYTEAIPIRLLRLSTGLRYEGIIHESWVFGSEHRVIGMQNVILHHDGYVVMDKENGESKRTRNVTLLRKTLEQEPDDLRRLQEFLESGSQEPDFLEMTRYALSLVGQKRPKWERSGPSIYRCAVVAAFEKKLPELKSWIMQAEELFPNSFVVGLDIGYIAFGICAENREWKECIRRGERWIAAFNENRSGQGDKIGLMYGSVQTANPDCEAYVRIFTANAYLREGQPTRALELLEGMDGTRLDAERAGNFIFLLQRLHAKCGLDTAPLLVRFWEQINQAVPSVERAEQRRETFLENGAKAFSSVYIQKESEEEHVRHAYTIFLPLAGQCEIGTAAAMMETEDPAELEKLLGQIERWDAVPPSALEHALLAGAVPRSLTVEEMDALADGMTPDVTLRLAKECRHGDIGKLVWSRAAALAAVKSCDWEKGEQGLELARAFAEIEGAFLPQYYMPELLCDENIQVLPPMHRFGWYCARAFERLDGGDAVGYVQLLKKGLAANPGMKTMVEFLSEHTPQLQAPKPSGELLALAGQVRMLLSAYAPDDPAVEAVKRSPAYQTVAHLIEGPGVGLYGGLAQ